MTGNVPMGLARLRDEARPAMAIRPLIPQPRAAGFLPS
jgi:hypothetical protein